MKTKFILVISAIVIAFCSCGEDASVSYNNNKAHLAELANKSAKKMEDFKSCMDSIAQIDVQMTDTRASNFFLEEEKNAQLVEYVLEACDLLSKTNLDSVCSKYGINIQIFEAVSYYSDHIGEHDVMSQMSKKFPTLSDAEFEQVFDSYYLTEQFLKYQDFSNGITRLDLNQYAGGSIMDDAGSKVSVDCAVAYTSLMVTVVGGAFVTGGASLVIWGASYALGVGGLILGCR